MASIGKKQNGEAKCKLTFVTPGDLKAASVLAREKSSFFQILEKETGNSALVSCAILSVLRSSSSITFVFKVQRCQ